MPLHYNSAPIVIKEIMGHVCLISPCMPHLPMHVTLQAALDRWTVLCVGLRNMLGD